MTNKIVFRDIQSPLGKMIAGATKKGVCFLEWHGRGGVKRIRERVSRRFKKPLVAGNNIHLGRLERELADYFAGRRKEFSVAIDLCGTPFERKTWRQLLTIPYGETRSYGQIASKTGKHKAVRAVGRTCGSNTLPILIPCHRVIAGDGKLHGYSSQLWRKRYLLKLEGAL